MNPPPDKRRKTEHGEERNPGQREEEEGEGREDLGEEDEWEQDFSQADLDKLDAALEFSQAAPSMPTTSVAPHRPPTAGVMHVATGVTHQRSPVTAGVSHHRPPVAAGVTHHRPPVAGVPVRGKATPAVSSSFMAPSGSSSKGKLSLTRPGQSSKGSVPTRPHPSSSVDPGHRVVAPSIDPGRPDKISAQHEKEVTDLKLEVHKLREELVANQGQITMQRDSLAKKEAEISQFKQEKMRQVELEQNERREREVKLAADLQKLETQLHFKEQEIVGLQDKVQMYEQKIKRLESTPAGSSSPRVKVKSEHKSPKRSPQSSGFPTQQSFMAQESGDTPQRRFKARLTEDKATSTDNGRLHSATSTAKSRRKTLQLECEMSTGVLRGAQVWDQVMDSQLDSDGQSAVSAIVRLLQPPGAAPVNFDTVQLEREAGSLLFSPKQSKRNSSLQRTISSSVLFSPSEHSSATAVVSPESIAFAYRGVSELLSCRDCTEPFKILTRTGSVSTGEANNNFLSKGGAILLLPLINDYLTHYLDMMTSTLDSNISSPTSSLNSLRASNSSSSDGSSFDSVSSSLNILLKNSAVYANNFEKLTLLALQLLYKLLCHCSGVSKFLMQSGFESLASPQRKTFPYKSAEQAMDVDQSAKNEPHPGTSKLEEQPEISPPSFDSSGVSSLCSALRSDLDILPNLFRLADPGRGDTSQRHNQSVVSASLDILVVLARDSAPNQIDSLSPLVTSGVIHNCLGLESTHSTLVRGLQLLTGLLPSPKINESLCSASDGCVLRRIYGLCSSRVFASPLDRTVIFLEIVDCLTNIASLQSCSNLLLDTNKCRCKLEVVKSLTLLMFQLVKEYRQDESEHVLRAVRNGAALLNILYQQDSQFTDRHYDVEHHYVDMIHSLTHVYSQPTHHVTHHENSALQELRDFDQEDSDYSQEDEDEMEVE